MIVLISKHISSSTLILTIFIIEFMLVDLILAPEEGLQTSISVGWPSTFWKCPPVLTS